MLSFRPQAALTKHEQSAISHSALNAKKGRFLFMTKYLRLASREHLLKKHRYPACPTIVSSLSDHERDLIMMAFDSFWILLLQNLLACHDDDEAFS